MFYMIEGAVRVVDAVCRAWAWLVRPFWRRPLCLVQARGGTVIYGICNLPRGHGNGSKVHQERLQDGRLWAEWRSVLPEDEMDRAERHIRPGQPGRRGPMPSRHRPARVTVIGGQTDDQPSEDRPKG